MARATATAAARATAAPAARGPTPRPTPCPRSRSRVTRRTTRSRTSSAAWAARPRSTRRACSVRVAPPTCSAAASTARSTSRSTQIARLVEEERGLQFEHAIEPELLPADEFDQRIAEMVRAEYPVEQADLDSRVLQLLGAVPRGTDLKALREDLMSGQVAGYYDPETGEVVVRVPEGGGSLDANGQTTLAHELDHALTDQALGLPDIETAGASDANLARLALVEGDATLLMQRFALQSIGLLDQLGAALGPDAAAAQQDLAGVPPYLRSELMFPYTTGMAYACRLQEDGGWRGVDAAYDRLPSSSAEVLFADRAGLRPVDPVDVEAPGGTWDEAERDTLGAAELQWLFQAPGGDESLAIEGADVGGPRMGRRRARPVHRR